MAIFASDNFAGLALDASVNGRNMNNALGGTGTRTFESSGGNPPRGNGSGALKPNSAGSFTNVLPGVGEYRASMYVDPNGATSSVFIGGKRSAASGNSGHVSIALRSNHTALELYQGTGAGSTPPGSSTLRDSASLTAPGVPFYLEIDIVESGANLQVDGRVIRASDAAVLASVSALIDTSVPTGNYLFFGWTETYSAGFIDDLLIEDIPVGDTTAPTLSAASGTATGATTATGSVTSNEAGTAWAVLTTSSTTPSDVQIRAGQDHTGSAASASDASVAITSGANSGVFSFTGLTASTTYWLHVTGEDSVPNVSTPVTSASSFTTDSVDTTAPTLTSVGAVVESNALAVISATTDEANGTMYLVVTTSSTPPSAAQVRAGQDHTGAAAVFAGNQAIGSTGVKTFNATGLTQLTGYYGYVHHRDAANNDSDVETTGLFTTFRNGATGQFIIDNTGSIGGNPEGILYNDVQLPGDADKWFSFRVIDPVTDTASLTLNADGSFVWTGTSADSFTYQLEVDGVDYDSTGNPGTEAQLVQLDPVDGTAPVLSSPTGTETGETTATGTVSTDEGNGTLYFYASTNSSESAATIVSSGSSQAVSGSGVQNVSFSGLTGSTLYYAHYVQDDSSSNRSNVVSSAAFTTDAPADSTPPTLTSPTGSALGATGASGSVSTNEANGTLYWVTTINASELAATVKAGSSQAVTATGVQNVTSSGLTPETTYRNHFVHRDAAGNDSTVSSSAEFTTGAIGTGGGNHHKKVNAGLGVAWGRAQFWR